MLVRPGLYREAVLLPRSGAADAPIRFRAEPPGSVTVTGADLLSGFERAPGAEPIYVAPFPYRFSIGTQNGAPVEHYPDDEPLWGRAEQVAADGVLLLPTADLASLRRGWSDRDAALRPPVARLGGPFSGLFAVDAKARRLYLWLADGADPATRRIETSTRPVLVGPHPIRRGRGVTDVTFSGFVFRFAANFPQRPAIDLTGERNLLQDCAVERMNGVGVSVHGVVRRCVIRDNGHVGGSAEGRNFLNEDTVWERNSWKPLSRDWEAAGVKVTRDGPGAFRRCSFVRNGGPGLWFDLDAHDIQVTQSLFSKNEGSGVFIEISRDISVRDSVLIGNGAGAVGSPSSGWAVGGIAVAESIRATIRNNLIRDNRDGVALREQGPRRVEFDGVAIDYYNRGHVVSRNVVAGNKGRQLAFWWDNAFFGRHPSETGPRVAAADSSGQASGALDPAKQGLTIDRNIYSAPRDSSPFLYGAPWRPGSRSFETLGGFQKATGFERSGSLTRR
ncbi:right-handed parallel beta-helix repeat-containing protein [Hansschlegelia zhihuaiae]|uniref:right-handed parallel beta-helix repeat-containing protein n=1 Tax=Hansschlegelia zhihuaiae TaxID=405005 RepID=UPI0013E8E906|nr:right-handed parallel beta-helix repeat-containing protein [Hansschlegelia zhihuaiae]